MHKEMAIILTPHTFELCSTRNVTFAFNYECKSRNIRKLSEFVLEYVFDFGQQIIYFSLSHFSLTGIPLFDSFNCKSFPSKGNYFVERKYFHLKEIISLDRK